jgi:hypothetical protein
MRPNGFRSVTQQDLFCLLFALGRPNANPQDETARGHLGFELLGLSPAESAGDEGAQTAAGDTARGGEGQGSARRDDANRSRGADECQDRGHTRQRAHDVLTGDERPSGDI